ncbi:4Fe-4S binding protein [Geobacter anodireducens]
MKRITSARISQLLFLLLFLVLFVNTEYRGRDEINGAVNALFRADPLVAATYLLAAKTFTWLLLPAVLLLVATALLGRFFCGWVCPLGTILDLLGSRFRRRGAPPSSREMPNTGCSFPCSARPWPASTWPGCWILWPSSCGVSHSPSIPSWAIRPAAPGSGSTGCWGKGETCWLRAMP